jgi:exodeoxyribonuclease-5
MVLTKGQKEAIKISVERFKNKEKFTTIGGFAGCGKSFIIKYIVEELNLDESKVAYCSYTGKAAEVLRAKGNKNVLTLHKLLFEAHLNPDGTYTNKKVKYLPYRLIVVDECSMVNKEMIDLLLSHNIHVIFLGDNGQLSPVKSETNNLLDNPHVFLDEITRTALDSEIIRLSMKIRNGEKINYYKGKDVMVIPKKELNTGHLQWADIMLCSTNDTRKNLNNQKRQILGFSGLPQHGDRIICLANDWRYFSDNMQECLINGAIGTLENPYETFYYVPNRFKIPTSKVEVIKGCFCADSGCSFDSINLDKNIFVNDEPTFSPKECYDLYKKRGNNIIPKQFDYGYAITTWKAQGSQYDKVLAIEEGFPYNKKEHNKLLYTMCTRSSNKLVLVKG